MDDNETAMVEPEAPPVRTVEQWAEAKGMLPQFLDAPAPFGTPGAAPPRQHNPAHGRFYAARMFHGWPQGKELTEAEFDAAIADNESQTYR